MAGHSHWKQIKQHKGAADVRRSKVFSKLLRAITVAARDEHNPDFNPRLRTMIEKAKKENVPNDAIQRAIQKTSSDDVLEELIIEAYTEGGGALIIEALTDSKNRTMNEMKLLFKDYGARLAEQGSVQWAFENLKENGNIAWKSKFPLTLQPNEMEIYKKLKNKLLEHDDVQNVYSNINE